MHAYYVALGNTWNAVLMDMKETCITSEIVQMNNELFNVLSKTGAFAYYVTTRVYVPYALTCMQNECCAV